MIMGDMADYHVEQFPATWMEEDDCGYHEQYDCFKICKFCGRRNLHWENRNGKWRLCDNRGLHRCPVNPLKL